MDYAAFNKEFDERMNIFYSYTFLYAQQHASPLIIAIEHNDMESVKFWVKAGKLKFDMFELEFTKNENILHTTLNSYQNSDMGDGVDEEGEILWTRYKPLELCVYGGKFDMFKYLMESGANIHELLEEGYTILEFILQEEKEYLGPGKHNKEGFDEIVKYVKFLNL